MMMFAALQVHTLLYAVYSANNCARSLFTGVCLISPGVLLVGLFLHLVSVISYAERLLVFWSNIFTKYV